MARVRPKPADQICSPTSKTTTSPSIVVAQRPVTRQDNRRLQERNSGNTALCCECRGLGRDSSDHTRKAPMSELTYFERRKIQMEYAVPLIRDLQAILGEETILKALEERTRRQIETTPDGGQPDFSRMAEGTKVFAAGDALQYEVIAADDTTFDMNVHQCQYAEMMETLGGRDIGHHLVCNGDFAAAKRIGMRLDRTQTRMQGADFCDFRYRSSK